MAFRSFNRVDGEPILLNTLWIISASKNSANPDHTDIVYFGHHNATVSMTVSMKIQDLMTNEFRDQAHFAP